MNNIKARILVSTLMLKMPMPAGQHNFLKEVNFLMELTGDLLAGAAPSDPQSKWLSDLYRKYVTSDRQPTSPKNAEYIQRFCAARLEASSRDDSTFSQPVLISTDVGKCICFDAAGAIDCQIHGDQVLARMKLAAETKTKTKPGAVTKMKIRKPRAKLKAKLKGPRISGDVLK